MPNLEMSELIPKLKLNYTLWNLTFCNNLDEHLIRMWDLVEIRPLPGTCLSGLILSYLSTTLRINLLRERERDTHTHNACLCLCVCMSQQCVGVSVRFVFSQTLCHSRSLWNYIFLCIFWFRSFYLLSLSLALLLFWTAYVSIAAGVWIFLQTW